MKKMPLKKVVRIGNILFWLGAVVICVGYLTGWLPLTLVGAAVWIASAVFALVFYRCPHCGKQLGRAGGEYCPFCGEKLDI